MIPKMRNHFFPLFLICFVKVQSESYPEPPRVPIGPFDWAENKVDVSPVGGKKSLFQGDIEDPGRTKGGKIGEAGTRTPWPNGIIPYVFDCSVLSIESAVRATYDAMKVWESKTCVKFVEKRPEHTVYLEFIRAAGCWATFVGYKGKKTQISIGNGCDYKHVMIHELGHVIGFWHEQSRPDRDNYITINYGNVLRSLRYNFDIVKEQVNNYGEAYDFNSIMHYPFNAFAIDRRQNTIFPRDSSILNRARPYRKLSEVDARQTRKMYKCKDVQIARATMINNINDKTSKVNWATIDSCKDTHKHCKSWANAGFCDMSPDPMLTVCPQSCEICNNEKCQDDPNYKTHCPAWADYGYCTYSGDNANHIIKFMMKNCRKSCLKCAPAPTKKPRTKATTKPTTKPTTTLPPRTTPEPTKKIPTTLKKRTTRRPVTTRPTTKGGISIPTEKFVGVKCKDRSRYCKAWADDGRCDTDRWVYDNCMLSCKRYEVCDQTMIKPVGACTDALGVHSKDIIPDNKMYSTSTFVPGGGWYAPASSGRLYKEDDHRNKHVGAWCAQPGTTREKYLQIDFGRKKRITAVATQGRDVYFEHVKSYTLSFSNDRYRWEEYREGGKRKVFDGNCDHKTPVMNLLQEPQYARYIRFNPVKYIGAACLRVEVYGC